MSDGNGAQGGGAGGGGQQGAATGGEGAQTGATGGGTGGGADAPFYSTWNLDTAASDFVIGKGFKTPADLAKSAMLSDQLARERNVIKAPDLAKIDDWEGWGKLGWDADFGKYKIADAKVPEGLTYSKDMELSFLQAMHSAKIPPHQAQAVRDGVLAMLKNEATAQAQRGAAERDGLANALKNEWGPQYDARSEMAGKAARALGLGVQESAELEKIIGAPRLVKMFANLGERLGEDVLAGGAARSEAPMSPEAAGAERRRLETDREFIKSLGDPRHPQHKENSQRRQRLIAAEMGAKA